MVQKLHQASGPNNRTLVVFKTLNYVRGNFRHLYSITSGLVPLWQREMAFKIFGDPYQHDMRGDEFPVKILDVFPMTMASFDMSEIGNVHPLTKVNRETTHALLNFLSYHGFAWIKIIKKRNGTNNLWSGPDRSALGCLLIWIFRTKWNFDGKWPKNQYPIILRSSKCKKGGAHCIKLIFLAQFCKTSWNFHDQVMEKPRSAYGKKYPSWKNHDAHHDFSVTWSWFFHDPRQVWRKNFLVILPNMPRLQVKHQLSHYRRSCIGGPGRPPAPPGSPAQAGHHFRVQRATYEFKKTSFGVKKATFWVQNTFFGVKKTTFEF